MPRARRSSASCRSSAARRTSRRCSQRKLDEYTQKLRKRGFYEASATAAGAWFREDKAAVNLTIAVRSGPGCDRQVRRRSAACRPVEGAGAGRARQLGGRGPARGLGGRDPRLPAPAGLLEGGRVAGGARSRPTRWRSCSRSRRGCATSSREPVALSGNQALSVEELRTHDRAEARRRVPRVQPRRWRPRRSPSSIASVVSPRPTVKYRAVETDPRNAGGRARSGRPSSSPKGAHRSSAPCASPATRRSAEAELRPLVKLTEGQPLLRSRRSPPIATPSSSST